ncbi:MAG TPA: hypothetical protein VK325_04845 [Pseudoxanthomonas sp.]|nr:hypothetical protein [Pseudoxanthomonas sp.]
MAVQIPPPALPVGLSWSSGKDTIHLRMHDHIVARAEPRGTAWLITANMHAASGQGNLVTCIAPNRLRAQRWLAQWARIRLCRKTASGDIEVIPCDSGSAAA